MVGFEFRYILVGGSFGERVMLCEYLLYNVIVIVDELMYVLLIDRMFYVRLFGVYKLDWEKKVEFVK